MKEINSNQLGTAPIEFGEQAAMLDLYDGLKTPFSEDTIILSREHVETVKGFVASAIDAFGDSNGSPERTRAHALGVPSLLVRVDCTVNDSELVPYEMEDSPSGVGIADRFIHAASGNSLKDRVLNHYGNMAGDIPHVIISGARKHGTDDAVIVGEQRYHYEASNLTPPAIGDSTPVIVKAIPGNLDSAAPYLPLQNRCLSPLVTEGNKTYAKRIGIASTAQTEDDLLKNDGELASQAVKAAVGSMSMGVAIYLTPEDRRRFGKGGTVSAGRLAKDLKDYTKLGQEALVEPFHPPVQFVNSENRRNAIMRVFVTLMRHGNTISFLETNVLGGAYVARPELIVHGASNAISGAVLVE